jgi:hypothetical protein
LIAQSFTSAGILLAKAKPLSKVDFYIFNWYQRAFRSFFVFKNNQWAPIFFSLENVFVMGNVLEHSMARKM